MNPIELGESRFPIGRLVITSNAAGRLSEVDVSAALQRHVQGDWGDVCDEDRQSNDLALIEGDRLLSVYNAKDETRFWIITEADRTATTVLLPEDY